MGLRLRRVVCGFAALSVICGVRAAWSEFEVERENRETTAETATDNARSADNR
jgi:hypothetical protein